MKRSAPLQRKTRLRARRNKPRSRKTVVRLKGKELLWLRFECYARDRLTCQDCGVKVHWMARFAGDPEAYDMAHIKSRGAGGSDTLDNVVTKCHRCHLLEHSGKLERK